MERKTQPKTKQKITYFVQGKSPINNRQETALKYVEKHGRITNMEYRKLFPKITSRTVLNDLVDKKLLQKKGKTKGAFYTIPK